MEIDVINSEIDDLYAGFRTVLSDAEATERGIEIPTLEVLPAMRGQGIGSAFVAGLVEIGSRHRVPVLVALGNERLVDWYRRFGFEWPDRQIACNAHGLPMMVAAPAQPRC